MPERSCFTDIVYKIIQAVILVIAGVLLTIIAINGVLFHVHLSVETDQPELVLNAGGIAFAAILLLFLCLLCRYVLKRISEKLLVFVCVLIWVSAGVFLIMNATPSIHADAGMLYDYVERFNAGNYEGLQDGKYFSFYPKLLSLLTYDRLVSLISFSPRFYFTLELLWSIGSFLMIWVILCRLIESDLTRKTILVMLILYLPSVFGILAVYGVLIANFLSVTAVYCVILQMQSKKIGRRILYSLFASACLGLMYVLKQNYLIAVVAFVLMYCLLALKDRKWRYAASALVIIADTGIISAAVPFGYSTASGMTVNSGAPVILHIAEGLQPHSGNRLLDGSYNGYNFDVFADSGYDSSVAGEVGKQYLAERIPEMMSAPVETLQFFWHKIISTWNEPTQESILRGSSRYYGETPQNMILNSLYESDRVYSVYTWYMAGFDILIYCGALGWLIRGWKGRKYSIFDILIYMYFVGGFLFYLISETKSSYVYQYVYALIPAAGSFWSGVIRSAHSHSESSVCAEDD